MSPTSGRLRTTLIAASALVLILCTTAACGTLPGETITEDEAAEKVQEHIDGTLAALPEDAELETRQGTLSAACDDPSDGGPRDRVTISERFWIRGLLHEDNDANIDLMHEYWAENGYEVLRDEREDKVSIVVENEGDAFRMSLRVSNKDSLSLGASSPCAWPDGQ